MMDRYVDLAECSRYCRHFVAAAEPYQTLDPLLGKLMVEQSEWLTRLEATLAQADSSRSVESMTGGTERSASEETALTLRRTFDQLKALEHSYTFDFKRFFETGRKQDIGESIADRTRALERCIDAYQVYTELPNATEALESLKDLHSRLTNTSSSRSSQGSQKRMDTQALRSLRSGWAEHYKATRLIVHGLLKRAGRESEWKSLFMDA